MYLVPVINWWFGQVIHIWFANIHDSMFQQRVFMFTTSFTKKMRCRNKTLHMCDFAVVVRRNLSKTMFVYPERTDVGCGVYRWRGRLYLYHMSQKSGTLTLTCLFSLDLFLFEGAGSKWRRFGVKVMIQVLSFSTSKT